MLIDPPEKNYFIKKNSIQYNGKLIDLSRPLVMGILNLTPDSFYDGGRYATINHAVNHVGLMIQQGASIIDIGACSTRPGAEVLTVEEELKRLKPVVRQIKRSYPNAILSIDTYRSEVAKQIVGEFGDCIINDISGGTMDPNMFETVAKLRVPYILMHIKGIPGTMQQSPSYENVTKEVIKQLSEGVYKLHELGVNDVVIDPGFGFGKTLDHNFELFNHLDAFRFFELPLLVGISRKSMIFKLLNSEPNESLNGTTALNILALQAGANFLRVHDVKEAVEAVDLFEKIKQFAK
ncbi:MAG: dihydropteroate synthase [Prolixibacteraceae bacterium]|jgi:dihydropteroate synthase|nr:dihydropteroate synthase [Prolixibacteraceae bacterium]